MFCIKPKFTRNKIKNNLHHWNCKVIIIKLNQTPQKYAHKVVDTNFGSKVLVLSVLKT